MKITCYFIILLLLSGCIRTERINGNAIEVNGVGIDMTFYPVVSIRAGVYKYIIVKNDDKEIIVK